MKSSIRANKKRTQALRWSHTQNVARGGNGSALWQAVTDAWAVEAVQAARAQGAQDAIQAHRQEILEQRQLYGRVLQPPTLQSDRHTTALALQPIISRAIETEGYDQANELYRAWAHCYDIDAAEDADEGAWLMAHTLGPCSLQSMLALHQTAPVAAQARRLERRWLDLTQAESLHELLAQAQLQQPDHCLPHTGTARLQLQEPMSCDRMPLGEVHDSYQLTVQGGYLNASHRFGETSIMDLSFSAGRLMAIHPGGMHGPTKVSWTDGSVMYAGRARDLFDDSTIVQLHHA